MVKLDNKDIELINEISKLKNLNEYDYNPADMIINLSTELVDDDYILDLMSFIDDKKMEYGFNKDYTVNELGKNLTKLWDKIYYESEN